MKHSVQKSLLIFILFTCPGYMFAQQTRIDSIVQMLKNSKNGKEIDTARFTDAVNLIEKTLLNDESIAVLEKAGRLFINGKDEYWSYRVKFSILNSLIATDKNKSLAYGKSQLAELGKSKTPNVTFISSGFIKQLRLPYRNSNMLSEGFQYFNENLKIFKQKNDSAGLADCYYVLAGFYRTIGLLDQAIYHMKKSVSYMRADTAKDNSIFPFPDPVGRSMWFNNTGVIGYYYLQKGDYNEALKHATITFKDYKRANSAVNQNIPNTMAQAKLLSGKLDSVMYYIDMSLKDKKNKANPDYIAAALQIKGFYLINTGRLEEAEASLMQCWQLIEENNIPADARPGTMAPDYYLALIRIEQNRINEAIALLEKDIDRLKSQRLSVLRDYKLLAKLHEQTGNHKKANEALQAFISLQESLQDDQDKYGSLSFETEQQMNEKELSIAKLESQNKISSLSRNFSIGIAVLLLLIAAGVYNKFHSKKKANLILEKTLTDLKSAQSQLIQSEKMASLGELTAGIAHEIQNPLNFVNNFSDVNAELIEEMKAALKAGNHEGAIEIAIDIAENEQKINHHGKRADAIVKGMLQHSRTSSGQIEPTDINALADEYLRLSYHGLRAKDKSFSADLETNFDPDMPKINVIPQDIGRVLLNLINNAFYAVNARKTTTVETTHALSLQSQQSHTLSQQMEQPYRPTVTVTTKNLGDRIEITVKDNGNGIPEEVKNKIFQPFFTTKPTGQGTGLGLSLSYDIVKAHGGELSVRTPLEKVEAKEGGGSEFIIQLMTM